MKDIHEQSYYELLEVEPSATQEDILKAYNRARATYGHNSPALYSLFNKEEAQELLRLIDEAYSVLSNQFKRRQYDNSRSSSMMPDAIATVIPSFASTIDSGLVASAPSTDFAIPSAAALGDFYESPADPVQENISVAPSSSDEAAMLQSRPKAESPPSGLGSTPFGSYKIDSTIEEEINTATAFNGELIKRIRIYKNVSLDQISEVTKVSRPYLNAIENNNFSSLPAPVFLRGFLIQIAKVLSLDGNKVASSYLKLAREGQAQ